MDERRRPVDPLAGFTREDLFDFGELGEPEDEADRATVPEACAGHLRGRALFDALRANAAGLLDALEQTDGGLSWRRIWPDLAAVIDRLKPTVHVATRSPELAELRPVVARCGVSLTTGVYHVGQDEHGAIHIQPQRVPQEDDPVEEEETRLMVAVLVSQLWPFGGRHFKPLDLNLVAWLLGALPSGSFKRGVDRPPTPENVEWRGVLRVLQWIGGLDVAARAEWAEDFALRWRCLHDRPPPPANGTRYTWAEFAALPRWAAIPWGTYPDPEAEKLPPATPAQKAIWEAAASAERAASRQRSRVAARQAFKREYNRVLRRYERDGVIPPDPD